MSVVDWVCKKISLESASERLSAITISRQQVLLSKLDACANVTTCCSLGGVFFSAKHVTKTSNQTVYRLFVVTLCLPECGSLFPGG